MRESYALQRGRGDRHIWTESRHKYAPDEVVRMARDAGFRCEVQWLDGEWPFADSVRVAE